MAVDIEGQRELLSSMGIHNWVVKQGLVAKWKHVALFKFDNL